ncbi:RNA-directed DNA polymerase, eukaryota [Tanacetum coccineum]
MIGLNISKSVYVTNFPDSTSARDLWKVCSAYGTVVDVFIPFKKSKAGKRFAFVRFIKVNEVPTIPNLPVLIAKEGFLNVKIKYLGGMWLLFDFDSSASKQKFRAHTVRDVVINDRENNHTWLSRIGFGRVRVFDAWVPDFEDVDDSLSSVPKVKAADEEKPVSEDLLAFMVLMGDFNEVRSERERFDSVFNQQGATAFNQFISSSSLIDPPLDGYAFTWSHKNASKLSKLGFRGVFFLPLSEGLFDFFPHLSAICLDKNLSDHRPILLRESCLDYGPTPFRKLQLLKIAIKSWTKEFWTYVPMLRKCQIQQDILCLDKLFDLGLINDDSLNKRALLLNELHEINSVNASELSQKAKIRWS